MPKPRHPIGTPPQNALTAHISITIDLGKLSELSPEQVEAVMCGVAKLVGAEQPAARPEAE